jgi:hypothetical protein
MNYATLLSAEMALTRKRVERLTGITEDRQNMLLFDSGYDWLELTTGNDAQALQHMPRTKEFWGFWKKTWHRVDIAFLRFVHDAHVQNNLVDYYNHFHRITKDNAIMNGTSVQCDYHLLIKGLAVLR